jgi:hypothetical protein
MYFMRTHAVFFFVANAILLTDYVTSHEEVSWPLTLRQKIANIHIFKWAY